MARHASALTVAGVVAILLGEVLVLHGADIVSLGFLSHDLIWAFLGLAVALFGLALALISRIVGRRAPPSETAPK